MRRRKEFSAARNYDGMCVIILLSWKNAEAMSKADAQPFLKTSYQKSFYGAARVTGWKSINENNLEVLQSISRKFDNLNNIEDEVVPDGRL